MTCPSEDRPTFTDEKGNVWGVNGSPHITTADSKLGGACASFGIPGLGDWLGIAYSAGLNLGSVFTIDLFARTSASAQCFITMNQQHAVHAGYFLGVDATGRYYAGVGQNTWPAEPAYLYAPLDAGVSSRYDMNPAHLVRECITNPDWGMGYGEADMDDVAFTAAADTLFDEGFGLSLLWDRQEPIEDFIADVVRTIDAVLYVDIATGLWVLKLVRDDYDVGGLPQLTASNVERIEDFARTTFAELVNQVTVRYWDAEADQDNAVTVTDDALVQMQGQIIGQTVDYPGITTQANATRAARRDLQALSKPLASCVLYCQRSAGDLREGDAFTLTWPDYGLDTGVIMRVVQIGYGDAKDGRVRIRATEDAFSTPVFATDTTSGSDWTSPVSAPSAATRRLVVEAPYYRLIKQLGQVEADNRITLNPDLGYLMATADSPTPDALNAIIATDSGAGYAEYDSADFCPTARLAAALAQEAGPSTVAIDTGVNLDEVTVGSVAQIDDELVRVDALSDTSLTLGRGVLDTVPAAHADNAMVFFWSGYSGSDQVEYVASESVDVKLLTATGTGTLAQAAAPADTVTMTARANSPYPPGNFKINATAYPELVSGDLVLTWAHRDRTLQSDQLIDTTESDIGPEDGVTYTLRFYGEDDTLGHTETGLTGTTFTYGNSAEQADFVIPDTDEYDIYWDYVELCLNMNGSDGSTTFTDSSDAARTVTAYGNAQIDSAQSKFGGASGLLDGTGDYLTVPDAVELRHTNSPFTFDCWVYVPTAHKSPYAFIATTRTSSGTPRHYQWYLNDGKPAFNQWTSGGSQYMGIYGTTAIPLDQWVHLEVCKDDRPTRHAHERGHLHPGNHR
jgi:hypothetical protein